MTQKHAACILMVDAERKNAVVVTRRNSEILGLPGGRQDPTDANARECARRELAEETGIILKSSEIGLAPLFVKMCGGFKVSTFHANFPETGVIDGAEHEPGVITKIVPLDQIGDPLKFEFWEYNKELLEQFRKTTSLNDSIQEMYEVDLMKFEDNHD